MVDPGNRVARPGGPGPSIGIPHFCCMHPTCRVGEPAGAGPTHGKHSAIGEHGQVDCRRAFAIEPVACHCGEATLRLMTSAVAVGGSPPPA